MRKYSVITYREATQIAREAMENDPLVYGSTLRVERSPYEITVFDKQGEIAFVAEYPTYAQACEVSDYLKSTDLYSEIRISNPEGLGE